MRSPTTHAGDAGADQGLIADDLDKLIKIGAKVVSHGRYVIFQMAEVAIAANVPRDFASHRGTVAAATTSASMRRSMHAFKSNRQKECVQIQGKWPDQTLDQRSGYPRCW